MAVKTLDWVKSQELPGGGLAAWPGMRAYPEVTGYMIPTLKAYGEIELCRRLGDWLESIQNDDGSWSSMDGIPHSFDTAACMEGLRAINRRKAPAKALAWLQTMLRDDGHLRIATNTDSANPRDLRSLELMGAELPLKIGNAGRNHYWAYALEGLLNAGYFGRVVDELERFDEGYTGGLVPNTPDGRGSDTCATVQIALLRKRCELDNERYVSAVESARNADGSFPHDNIDTRKVLWPCKYYLDLRLRDG